MSLVCYDGGGKIGKTFYLCGLFLSVCIGAVCWKVFKPFGSNHYGNEYKTLSIDSLGVAGNILVGDQEIRLSDINYEYEIFLKNLFESFENNSQQNKRISSQSSLVLRNQILVETIERKLLFQMLARDRSFLVTEKELDENCRKDWDKIVRHDRGFFSTLGIREHLMTRLCEQQIIDTYIKERIYANLDVTEAEKLSFYNENILKYSLPRRILIKHIHLPDERTAKNVIYRTNSRNFSKKAKKHSISPEAKYGGLLGPYTEAQMPPIFKDAFKLRTNQVSQVIKSTYGFHIIMVTKKYPKKTLAFQEVKEDIETMLIDKKKKKEYQRWLNLALNSIEIKTHFR